MQIWSMSHRAPVEYSDASLRFALREDGLKSVRHYSASAKWSSEDSGAL
jgi:hypothetical protein